MEPFYTRNQLAEIFEKLLRTDNPPEAASDAKRTTDTPDIARLITRKYRANVLVEKSRQSFQRHIDNCVHTQQPIRFTIPIGGYKKCHLSVAPEADWAEFFNMAFMKDLASQIAVRHRPGVQISYLVTDFIHFGLNLTNYPTEHFQAYFRSMQRLIRFYNQILKESNVRFHFDTVGLRTERKIFMAHYHENLERAREFWNDPANAGQITAMEKKARKNYYCPDRTPSEDEIRASAQETWTYLKTFFMLKCADKDQEIPVILRRGLPAYLHLRSFYNSVVQFWVGEGVIVWRRDHHSPTILSDNNLKKYDLIEACPTDRFSDLGKNFKTIKLVIRKEALD